MKKVLLTLAGIAGAGLLYAQTGHLLQGIGARNFSMGGAATAQPLDISGALHWNPAGIAAFTQKEISLNAGGFFSAPELSSSVTMPGGSMRGTTKDDRGVSIMPALAMVWGKEKSKHHFGISAFGISGFGVTFPQSATNPVNMPQPNGFGKVASNYQLLQAGITYAYQFSDKVSIGFAPTFNFAQLQLEPNPLSPPSMTAGYPKTNKASAFGAGAQVGIFYNSGKGIKLGASYKTQQYFSSFEFKNTYLNGSSAPGNSFTMNFPAILSGGIGYSKGKIDAALDYRMVYYKNTEGFEAKGWTNMASVKGFGWKNISIVSAGLQYKGIEKIPLRVGYTYSSNPIPNELAFFSVPATAIIKNAFQVGAGFQLGKNAVIDVVYHHGSSGGSTTGPILNPQFISVSNPYGALPGSAVSYKMSTDLIMVGLNLKL